VLGRSGTRALFGTITALHACAALYLSLVHQSGPGPAMAFLAAEAAAGRVGSGGILMLTPCHETPGYSHLHAPVPLRILDCSPRSDGSVSERDAFFAAPGAQLAALLAAPAAELDGGGQRWEARVGAVPMPRGPPSHVAFFDDVEPPLRDLLAARGYALRRSFFHAHFPVDRDQRRLLVYSS
jgi:phosphatidylinositol glycan class B